MKANYPEFEVIGFAPDKGSSVAVNFLLPKGFEKVHDFKPGNNDGVLALQSSWKAINDPSAEIHFFASQLEDEMSASNVGFIDTIGRDGHILGVHEDENHPENIAQFVWAMKKKGGEWLCRSKIIKNENWVYRIDANASKRTDTNTVELCTKACVSMSLPGKISERSAETTNEICLEQSKLNFSLPSSWNAARVSRQDSTDSLIVTKDKFGSSETIYIDVFKTSEVPDETEATKQFASMLTQKSFHLSGAALVPVEPYGKLRFGIPVHACGFEEIGILLRWLYRLKESRSAGQNRLCQRRP